MVKTYDEELGFEDVKTIDIKKEAQKRKEKAFDEIIQDAYAERGEIITLKEAHKIHIRDKKKSDSIRLERWKQYQEDATIYRMRTGKETPPGGHQRKGIDETIHVMKPGEKEITPEIEFKEEERPPEFKVKELRRENKELKIEVKKLRKELMEINKKIKLLEKRK